MKKLLLVLLFVGLYYTSFAQTDSTKTIYCELLGTEMLLSSKVTVTVDMGQKTGFWNMNMSYLVDENGKPKKFNSMVDAMNFMGNAGWDFAQAYAISEGNQRVYHFLLTQKITKGKDGSYFPATKTRKEINTDKQ